MPDLPTIFAETIAKCGAKARPRRIIADRVCPLIYDCGWWEWSILAACDGRTNEPDAANAIRCHWEDVLIEANGDTCLDRPTVARPTWLVSCPQDHYTGATLIEALAAAVQGECAK